MTRRTFVAMACGAPAAYIPQDRRLGDSLLRVRPARPAKTITPGEHPLGLASGRDGLLCVPKGYRPDLTWPLALLFHGAGGRASRIVRLLGVADSLGVIVLAPESRGATWDGVRGEFGPDVAFVTRALEFAFDRCAVDPRALGIGGFSDGATYALTLGLDNGALFTHVLAFSPGFIASRRPQGRPRVFVSHGTKDTVLPIDATSRRIVPALTGAGFSVTYREFDGPHAVPPEVAEEAFKWFIRQRSGGSAPSSLPLAG